MHRYLYSFFVSIWFLISFFIGTPLRHHPSIPISDLQWLHAFMKDGNVPLEDACYILRRKLFPFSYDPHPWVKGRKETTTEVLKSVLAIYVFRKEVNWLKEIPKDPADFSCNLYQPELNGNGSEYVHHRIDHNHLLKRIIGCLREGLIPGIDLRFMREALHDESNGLTYEALTRKNKQSVCDCERVISCNVVSFLERKVQNRQIYRYRFIPVHTYDIKVFKLRDIKVVQMLYR